MLLGSEGANTLTGGLGEDYFIFNQYSVWRNPDDPVFPGAESTTITDFTMGKDFLLAQPASDDPDPISSAREALDLDQFNVTYDTSLGGVVLSGNSVLAAESTIILEGITQAQWEDYLIAGDKEDNLLVATNDNPHALFGSFGSDILIGGAGNDLLYGGSEQAFVYNGLQHDRLVPGKGDDLVFFESGTVRSPEIAEGTVLYQTLELRGDSYEGVNTILGSIGRNPSIRIENIEVHYAVSENDADAKNIELFAFLDNVDNTFHTTYGNGGSTLATNVVFAARNPDIFSNHHKIVIDGDERPNHINASDNHFVGFAETEDLRHTINGYGGDDQLTGASRNDILDGGEGKDILDGGGMLNSAGETEADEIIKNADMLTGGEGEDTFIYEAGYQSLVITDFTQNEDHIEITGYSHADMSTSIVDGDTVLVFTDDDTIILQGFDDTLLGGDVLFMT